MLTLPSSFSSNFNSKTYFVVRLTVLDSGTPSYLYASTIDLSPYEVTYAGDIVSVSPAYVAAKIVGPSGGGGEDVQGIGEVDLALDVQGGGNVSSQGETKLIFLNQGSLVSSAEYDLENQPIEVWELRFSGNDVSIDGEGILRFRGVMRDAAEYDLTRWSVSAVDRRTVDTRVLPRTKLTIDNFPKLPADAVGRVSQIVLGRFWADPSEPALQPYDAVPCHLVDDNTLKFLVAEHPVAWVYYPIYKDSSGLQGYYFHSIDDDKGATPATFFLSQSGTRAGNIPAEFNVYPTLKGTYGTGTVTVDDWTLAVDGNLDTLATFNGGASGGTFFYTFNRFDLEAKLKQYSTYTGAYCQILYDFWAPSGSPRCCFGLRSAGTTVDGTILTSSQHAENIGASPFVSFDKFNVDSLFSDLEVGIRLPAGASIQLAGIWVRFVAETPNMGRRRSGASRALVTRTFGHTRASDPLAQVFGPAKIVDAAKQNPVNILIGCNGATFSSAMTSGRSNGFAVGDVIENPAYAIEWILRDRLGMSTADIDVDSFDAIGNATNGTRKTWKLATVLNRQADAFEVIREICFEFGLQFFVTNAGKYKLVTMDTRTEDLTLTAADIAFDEGNGPMATLLVTPNSAISNDVYANYRIDYQTNEAVADVYVSDIDGDNVLETNFSADSGSPWGGSYSAFMASSRVRYGTAKPLQITFEYIREAATAEGALKKIIDWVCFQRLICRATLVRNLSTVRLEPGDVIKINTDLLPATHKNVTKFLVTRVNQPGVSVVGGSPFFSIEAEEIPNSSTGVPVVAARYISSDDLSAY